MAFVIHEMTIGGFWTGQHWAGLAEAKRFPTAQEALAENTGYVITEIIDESQAQEREEADRE